MGRFLAVDFCTEVRILIIGSSGFIGGSLGRFAAAEGHEVFGVGRAPDAPAAWPGGYFRQADADTDQLANRIKLWRPEVVLHAAGSASVEASLAAPLRDFEDSAFTLARTLESVRQSQESPLIIFPSSAAVYGNPAKLPVSEAASVKPISPYGFHMAVRELIAREYAECYGLRILACRLFSVFGLAQRRLFVWELYERLVAPSATVCLQGTGAETRDYLHIEDVASAFLKLAQRAPISSASPYRIVNVASGDEIGMLDLAKRIRDLVAPEKQISCRGVERLGHPVHWRADISLLRSIVPQWQPQPFDERLRQCIDSWRRSTTNN